MTKTNTRRNSPMRIGLLAGAAFLAMSQSALALEADAFASRVESLFKSFGLELDLGDAVAKGDKIVVSGFTSRVIAEPDSTPTVADTELTFTGVEEIEGGGYTVESLTIPDIAHSNAEGGFSLVNIAFSDLYIPGGDQPTAADLVQLLGNFSAGPMTVSNAGAQVLSVESITSENSYLPQQGTPDITNVTSNLKVNGINVDLSGITEPEGRAFVEGLGISAITGEFSESMEWSLESGKLDVSEFSLNLGDLGRLDMTMGLSGYTLPLLTSITQASQEMAELTGEENAEKRAAAEQALGMSVLAQLSVTGLSVRYEDASLADKLIEMMATQQNMPAAVMREGLKVAAQQALNEMGAPELVAAASGPIATFLDNTESLEIRIAPSRAVSFIEMVALAQTPAVLLQTMQLQITANQ